MLGHTGRHKTRRTGKSGIAMHLADAAAKATMIPLAVAMLLSTALSIFAVAGSAVAHVTGA